jgi:hypothetical protein
MADEETYIVKHRDLSEIIRIQNQSAIEEFLKDPLAVVAGAVNGLLLHPSVLASTAVRVAHAALKGQLFQQFASEIKDLQAKGKLPEDFSANKNGYNTWVDLLKIIDDECPDEDRLEALKAMFFAANSVNAADGERIVAYELFQIAKSLSSNELLVLMTMWKLLKSGRLTTVIGGHVDRFQEEVSRALGHSQKHLVLLGYRRLPDKGLVDSYQFTPLGQKFCENIQTYRTERGE